MEEQVWRGQRRRGGEEGEREVRGGEGVGRVEGGEAEGGEAGIRGEEVRRVRGRENRQVGRKKRKLDRLQMIVSYSLWLYEILLPTLLFCSLPTISRQYGSQESSQDEEEDIH